MARLLCYSLRVLQSCEDSEKLGSVAEGELDDSRGSESDRDDGSEYDENCEGDSDSGAGSNILAVIDIFKDARRLYPW